MGDAERVRGRESLDDRVGSASGEGGELRLRDGRVVTVRPITAADAAGLVALHGSCSAESQFLRFHSSKPKLRAAEAQYLAASDGRDRVAFVVTVPAAARELGGDGTGERIVADARFDVTGPGEAEAAFLVCDDYQGSGLGSALLGQLAAAATARGLQRLALEVLAENRAMIILATRAGARPTRFDGRSIRFALDLETFRARTASPLRMIAEARCDDRPRRSELVLPEDGDSAEDLVASI